MNKRTTRQSSYKQSTLREDTTLPEYVDYYLLSRAQPHGIGSYVYTYIRLAFNEFIDDIIIRFESELTER
jgi:hypothetical protein